MSGKEKLEAQLAALDSLRHEPPEAALSSLRSALRDHNNYLVAKAADQVADRRMAELLPELVTALDRFFDSGGKRDPQCWAKNSLSRALAALEWQEPEPFLRGLRHVQLEPVWGGRSDTAGALRGICGLALVQCRILPEVDLLRYMVDLLHDEEKTARLDAVRAVVQVGSPGASLLLRMRALAARGDPETFGACCAAVVRIEGAAALAWLQRFLQSEADEAGEAALAIASVQSPEALALLQQRLESARDPWFRSVLLSAIALTRQKAATDFLLRLVAEEGMDAEAGLEALLRALPPEDVVLRLREMAGRSSRLAQIVARHAGKGQQI